jgi:predicted phosphohydrolase
MTLWGIADTHLSLASDKPMDVFGPSWENYVGRLKQGWQSKVGPEDTVLILGDISWALKLEEAVADLTFLHSLPGKRKILLRGNHDFWWTTRTQVQGLIEREGLDTLELFQNEALYIEEYKALLVGTRGWKIPTDDSFSREDEKVYKRELNRLDLSIQQGKKIKDKEDVKSILGLMHYPPLARDGRPSDFALKMEDFGVSICCYGHVHGPAGRQAFSGLRGSCSYMKLSSDLVDFTPVSLLSKEEE